jgi:hypothetical protein
MTPLSQIVAAYQQTGFVRSKRHGLTKMLRDSLGGDLTMASDEDLLGGKRSPWVSLREALDQDQVAFSANFGFSPKSFLGFGICSNIKLQIV